MLAVLIRQLGIDEIPLGLEGAPEDCISGLLGGHFEVIRAVPGCNAETSAGGRSKAASSVIWSEAESSTRQTSTRIWLMEYSLVSIAVLCYHSQG